MQTLREIHDRLINSLEDVYRRKNIDISDSKVIVGLVGPRGVGKTTFLLDYIKTKYGVGDRRALYVSADNIYFSQNTLVDLALEFVNNDAGELLCIDEIHRYENWAQELKNIFDSFPKLRVVFSGSSSINIVQQKYDLSRRVLLKYFPGLSFREWLEFREGMDLPKISIEKILKDTVKVPEEITDIRGLLGLFKEYLKTGYYPLRRSFATDGEFYSALISSIDKTIYQDIGSYYTLKTPTLKDFMKILYFVAQTQPGKVNPNAIARSLGRYHQDVANYIDMMRNSSLFRYLLIDKTGHAQIRNAEKVYLDNTNLAFAIEENTGKTSNLGTLRENFAINQLQNAGKSVLYSKNGDFTFGKYTIEIGGAGKSGKQIDNTKNAFVFKDDIVYKSGKYIPLYVLGFLY